VKEWAMMRVVMKWRVWFTGGSEGDVVVTRTRGPACQQGTEPALADSVKIVQSPQTAAVQFPLDHTITRPSRLVWPKTRPSLLALNGARPDLKRSPAAHTVLCNRNATSHATSKWHDPVLLWTEAHVIDIKTGKLTQYPFIWISTA